MIDYNLPVPILSLQERQARKCLAAFLTLSPFALKNLSTQALLQNFSCFMKQTINHIRIWKPQLGILFSKYEKMIRYIIFHETIDERSFPQK